MVCNHHTICIYYIITPYAETKLCSLHVGCMENKYIKCMQLQACLLPVFSLLVEGGPYIRCLSCMFCYCVCKRRSMEAPLLNGCGAIIPITRLQSTISCMQRIRLVYRRWSSQGPGHTGAQPRAGCHSTPEVYKNAGDRVCTHNNDNYNVYVICIWTVEHIGIYTAVQFITPQYIVFSDNTGWCAVEKSHFMVTYCMSSCKYITYTCY